MQDGDRVGEQHAPSVAPHVRRSQNRPELGREQGGRLGQRRAVPGEVPAAHEHRPACGHASGPSSGRERVGLVGEDDEVGGDPAGIVLGQPRVAVGRAPAKRLSTPSRRSTSPAKVSRPSTIHGRRQIGTTAVTRRHLRRVAQTACPGAASPGPGRPARRTAGRASRAPASTVAGAVTHTRIPAARSAATSSSRFSSALATTRSGRSASTRSTSGHLVPPTRGTSRSAGWVHQSVAPASSRRRWPRSPRSATGRG